MSNPTNPIPPILESAWKRVGDYGNTARHQKKQYYLLRRWVLIFSITATFLAILLENFREFFPGPVVTFLQVILILVPISGSVIVAFLSKYQQGQKYLAMRAGAEEILKEIYLYRTVMQGNPNRDKWLNNRLAEIQRQVHRTLGGEVVVKPYTGAHINPRYYPDSADADEGIADLNSAEYLRMRLESQLAWHTGRIQEYHKARMRLTILILAFGGLGALFAGADMLFAGIAIWVAMTTAVASALTNWQELMGVDIVIPNYSKVILELNILRDHWFSLAPSEQTQVEFYKMVRSTEKVLWSQNVQFISAMKESMEDAEAEQERIIADAIEMSQEVAGQVQAEIIEEARRSMEEAAQAAAAMVTGKPVTDDQRLPTGVIFNAALGPVEAVIVKEDEEDAPDGFIDAEEKTGSTQEEQASTQKEEAVPEPAAAAEIQDDDSVLAAINSAVAAAIEESDAVKSSSGGKTPADLSDDAIQAAQDAAGEYVQNASDSFEDEA